MQFEKIRYYIVYFKIYFGAKKGLKIKFDGCDGHRLGHRTIPKCPKALYTLPASLPRTSPSARLNSCRAVLSRLTSIMEASGL
jgi:hypothetical protein